MLPERVWFLSLLGLKRGIHQFGSGIGYGFRWNYGSVWTYLSFQFQMIKEEREICEFEMNLKNFVYLRSNLKNNDIISSKSQVWKRVWILEVWSEYGCEKWHFLAWIRVRIWRTGRHTPTQEFPRLPPGGFRSEKKGYPVYYDQHLTEMHSFSSLQKSHRVNRSLIRYWFRTGAKAIRYRVKMAWVA